MNTDSMFTLQYFTGHLLIVFVIHVLAAPTPTTFSAVTDTLLQLEGGFEDGSKVWLHLPAVHLATFTFPVITTDPVWKLIWYCVMFPVTPGHRSTGSWSEATTCETPHSSHMLDAHLFLQTNWNHVFILHTCNCEQLKDTHQQQKFPAKSLDAMTYWHCIPGVVDEQKHP